jgi:hypothetical protein
MPAAERRLPIIHHAGKWWTPEDILRQVETCPTCPLSIELQRLLEVRALGQDVGIHELAKARLLELLRVQPVQLVTYTLGLPKVITSEQLKREVETEGFLGSSLIRIQERRAAELLSKY